MRLGRSIEEKHGVNEPGYTPHVDAPRDTMGKPPPPEPAQRYDISLFGLGLVCVGAVGMVIAEFLPIAEAAGETVRQNTPVQQEEWQFFGFAAFAALAAYRSYRKGRRGWAPIIWGLLGLASAVYMGTNKSLRTLYPLGVSQGSGTLVPVGIAAYVAGAASLLVMVGGRLMRQSSPVAETQRCPECAETILAAARVCKHCGAHLAE